ncbi:hypothetical protein P175DRAFT_0498309 [Aspergillus ochraceoroseus IBT 24754]|uniref:Uncharacterized protein n=1 Tax=Aspergillus ochraceoroseus IBT 24754 TaxID=1392256 RepID=A0A2T5M9K9_9EURO|nr:uncharacterized protein P175DRAFT_0498309 [Aspergillus ochraceoroseus IBT 24754]PTU25195.1 hypothetical protein P175DRAFT_0498309 [Aspergillus ochraceoroseus IBT 24754]
MPASATPSRPPIRSNTRPQFASTPRFLLSQRAAGPRKEAPDDIDSILSSDDATSDPLPTPRPAPPAGQFSHRPRRKEIIEDHGVEPDQITDQTAPGDNTTSPLEGTTKLDPEIEALLGPTSHRTKRRRVLANTVTPWMQSRQRLDIPGSSPHQEPSSPSPSLPYCTPHHTRSAPTPQKTPPQPPPTPATTKASGRSIPRFLVSPFNPPPPPPLSSQPVSRIKHLTETPPSQSPPARRKPGFVLPRSPSPSQTEDSSAIPTPFSPSSGTLHRRGRGHSSAPSYLPGGMAAEVRSWILEMGTKREQPPMSADTRTRSEHGLFNMQRYTLVLRINNVRQSALGSCGPIAFVQGHPVTSLDDTDANTGRSSDDSTERRNLLLLGAPRPRADKRLQFRSASPRVPDLKHGDLVGVCWGLVWELNSDNQQSGEQSTNMGSGVNYDQVLRSESARSPHLGKWLVGMEWELIPSPMM